MISSYTGFYKEMGKYPEQDKQKAPTKIRKPRNIDRYSFYHGFGVILHVLFTCVPLSPKSENSGSVCAFNSRAEVKQPRAGLWHSGGGAGLKKTGRYLPTFRHHPSENSQRNMQFLK